MVLFFFFFLVAAENNTLSTGFGKNDVYPVILNADQAKILKFSMFGKKYSINIIVPYIRCKKIATITELLLGALNINVLENLKKLIKQTNKPVYPQKVTR